MGDRYVLVSAAAPRFLRISNSLQIQPQNKTKNPLHEIMMRYAMCVYLRDRPTRVKEPVVHVRLWWIMEIPK